MNFMPICLNVENSKIVVVGGGKIAEQKLRTILQYTRNIIVCAPDISTAIRDLELEFLQKAYDQEMLDGAAIVYACTNNRSLNRQIASDAKRQGILACAVDDPEFCEFISPAIYKKGHMSIAVSSNAKDVKRSRRWRNRIAEEFSHEDY